MLFQPARCLAAAFVLSVPLLGACGSSGGSTATNPASSEPHGPPAVASAKGKPCVAPVGSMPTGAPAVPVPVGPPPTQLVVRDLTPGSGAAATTTSTLTLDYTGVMCSNGKLLDASYSSGQPFTTTLGQVIPGWQQGIVGMKAGGTRLLGIPSDLAYGPAGDPPTIAPDEALWFVIELHDVKS